MNALRKGRIINLERFIMPTTKSKDIQQVILQATLDMVAERGFHGTSVNKIAKRADVSVGSIYYYFKDKDELIHAVFNSLEENLEAALREGGAEASTIKDRFVRLSMNLTIYLMENPVVLRFVEQYLASPYGVVKGKEVLVGRSSKKVDPGVVFKSLFEEGKACRSIKDLPLTTFYSLTLGTIFFLVNGQNAGIFKIDEVTIQKTIQTSWCAIGRDGFAENS